MIATPSPLPSHGEFLLLGSWGLWCTLHSLLIANPTVAFLKRRLGRGFRFHRLAYVTFSLVTILPLIHLTRAMDHRVLLAWEGYGKLVPAAGLTLAVILFLAGGRHYDGAQFLGLRQASSGANPRLLSGGDRLDTSGILGVVRHPWYTATFLLLWAQDLTALSIQVNALLSAYLVVGTLLEERKLVQEFGGHYRDYQRRVGMFVPIQWLRAKLRGGGR